MVPDHVWMVFKFIAMTFYQERLNRGSYNYYLMLIEIEVTKFYEKIYTYSATSCTHE